MAHENREVKQVRCKLYKYITTQSSFIQINRPKTDNTTLSNTYTVLHKRTASIQVYYNTVLCKRTASIQVYYKSSKCSLPQIYNLQIPKIYCIYPEGVFGKKIFSGKFAVWWWDYVNNTCMPLITGQCYLMQLSTQYACAITCNIFHDYFSVY